MEPVTTWSSHRVCAWFRGLDASLQQYPFERWQLDGMDLVQLSSQKLEQLGVHVIGHQELILDSVEKLCTLTYGLAGESVSSSTEKLQKVAQSLQVGIQSRWRVNTYDGHKSTKLPTQVLQLVLELITAAKGLYFLLNRYQYTEGTEHIGDGDIVALCKDLSLAIHEENTVFDKEKDIISISRQLVAICDDIQNSAPESLLTHTAQLQSVDLVPAVPGEQLGIEITSTTSSHHYISGTAAECPAQCAEKILAGDEVIQVNDQVVVGWSRKKLVEKLQENPEGVTLLLRRIPALSAPDKPNDKPKLSISSEKEDEDEEEKEGSRRGQTSVRSYSFRAAVLSPDDGHLTGPEDSELLSDHSLDGNQSHTHKLGAGLDSGVERRSPSPLALDSNRTRVGSWPDMGASVKETEKKASFKGKQTAMSRRRVSCRELGRPDCDGWLWKKRKEMSVFMTQKWQRFWFVLKGVTIYWYMGQQEEKAVGMVKIGSYSIESAGEHKRKYVFQMSHPRFQNFFFAADNVTDMSKWINCLITAIQKYKKYQQNPADNETECYSETESEEDGSDSPRLVKKKGSTKSQFNTLPRTLGRKTKLAGGGAVTTSPAGGAKATGTVDEMGELFNKLKEGGVSLIGQNQPTTHDQLRRSFIRRNKNPVINEKIHTLRALQSTLKAKEAELQLINKLLEESDLTPMKYREWKQLNDDLHHEIEKGVVEKKDEQDTSQVKAAPAGESGACGLCLSDGEQLVDAETPNNGERSPAPTVLTSTDTERAKSSSSDSYFYI
ncbi:connector enhancer of kinase suppressor of ras 1 [Trichomycterus rosablanca]|uniref:connector enhancer of kinase suppressor of ras 1 n=1 Tax=Trichomycterus rosablanca TaxID=2290929 RepID=UPI002F35E7F4